MRLDRRGDAFAETTRAWLERARLEDRRRLGQFMTPRPIRERLLDRLELRPGMRVLDPGVGTGEFLRAVLDREQRAEAHGWDVDGGLLDAASKLVPDARLEERSALEPYAGRPFDLVIGNPPYFQFRAPAELRRRFARVVSGRPNIFALFFQAAFDVLRPGGRVAYVVPPSMNNGAYFEALREYIVERAAIEHLEILDGNDLFANANTAVQLIVLRVGARADRHVFERACEEAGFRRTILAVRPGLLAAEFAGRATLWALGYEAVTGTLVWNQHRDRLRREREPGTVPLVWARNVGDGELRLDESRRPRRAQHVVWERPLAGPAVVVNRVVGAVGSGELRCALVPPVFAFVAENHVNVIRARRGATQLVSFREVAELLRRPEIARRIRLLTGNTQVSARELTHLVPLDAASSPARRAA